MLKASCFLFCPRAALSGDPGWWLLKHALKYSQPQHPPPPPLFFLWKPVGAVKHAAVKTLIPTVIFSPGP